MIFFSFRPLRLSRFNSISAIISRHKARPFVSGCRRDLEVRFDPHLAIGNSLKALEQVQV
jgi:hypothetical protein